MEDLVFIDLILDFAKVVIAIMLSIVCLAIGVWSFIWITDVTLLGF